MFGLYKKIKHAAEIEKTERFSQDPSILVLRTPTDISLYRHAFNSVRGAVHDMSLFTPEELAEVTRYAQNKITPEKLEAHVVSYTAPGVMDQYAFNADLPDNVILDATGLPKSVERACEQLNKLFHAATGEKAGNIVLSINNITPAQYHEHGVDVLTYTAQGSATMGRSKQEYTMPTGSAVLMKPGYWHKTPGEQSHDTPRLTLLVV